MGTDLESNTAHRTEVYCLDLNRSSDRMLEVINVLTVPPYSHLSLYIKKKSSAGSLLFRNSLRGLNQKVFDSARLTGLAVSVPDCHGPDIGLGANHMKHKAWRRLEEI